MTKTSYTNDPAVNKMTVTREFDAPVDTVWQAWTDSDILDEWWAPKPWKAKTKKMDFREGGHWLYCMNGPEGEKHWARADYTKIIPNELYEGSDAFCDKEGNISNELPATIWLVTFSPVENGTSVKVELTFNDKADMEKMVEMGFKEGFAAAHENLDQILENR